MLYIAVAIWQQYRRQRVNYILDLLHRPVM